MANTTENQEWDGYDGTEPIEPEVDDTVNCCPECERPNQFGETCYSCLRDMQDEL